MKKILGTLTLALVCAASAVASTGSMVCEKTGAEVESCCCIVKNGTMICTLTGEPVSSCCCRPAR